MMRLTGTMLPWLDHTAFARIIKGVHPYGSPEDESSN